VSVAAYKSIQVVYRVNMVGVESIAQLGDARGDLVEMDAFLATVALEYIHAWAEKT
jgi:hypothetical protein